MKLLGIDYGKRKIGLAITDGILAEPLKVLKVENVEDAMEKVGQVVQVEQVKQVIIGISEGKTAEETKEFGKKLEKKLSVPIIYQDETLTTQEAQELSQKAGIRRIKRCPESHLENM